MSTISSSNSSGEQLLIAALEKNHQQQQGKMALALIQAAVSVAPVSTSAPTANLGNHINIKA